jgi:hypothetical protein
MRPLSHERCFNHAFREAVARCPECARSFCRECVTEHDDRVLCAACLARVARKATGQRGWLRHLARASAMAAGLVVAWIFFLMVGGWVTSLPDDFHARTLWSGD